VTVALVIDLVYRRRRQRRRSASFDAGTRAPHLGRIAKEDETQSRQKMFP
jgi:hypothetical protein